LLCVAVDNDKDKEDRLGGGKARKQDTYYTIGVIAPKRECGTSIPAGMDQPSTITGFVAILVLTYIVAINKMTTIPSRLAKLTTSSTSIEQARSRSINAYRAWYRSVCPLPTSSLPN
jgi:hypothetical protein